MDLARYVDALTLLADENRLRLCALLRERELTVSELVRVTGLPQSRVSTHLGRLREAGVVRDRRAGTSAWYGLSLDGLPATVRAVLDEATQSRDRTLDGDRRRLRALDDAKRATLPEDLAGEMERHYSPGRTWESLAVGLAALLDLGDVLDVGSGDGAVAALLAPGCASLTCLDANVRMVEAATARLAKHDHVRCVEGDAEAMDFADRSFDTAVVFHTLTYAAHPSRVLAECVRVLRPGGRLVVLSLDAHDDAALTQSYGARHAGFAPSRLRALLTKAGATVASCEVACREARRSQFQVVLATAHKGPRARSRRQ